MRCAILTDGRWLKFCDTDALAVRGFWEQGAGAITDRMRCSAQDFSFQNAIAEPQREILAVDDDQTDAFDRISD